MVEAVAGARSGDLAAHDPGVAQDLQMLGDRRLGERQIADNLATTASGAADLRKRPHDRKARRVGKRLDACGEELIVTGIGHLISS